MEWEKIIEDIIKSSGLWEEGIESLRTLVEENKQLKKMLKRFEPIDEWDECCIFCMDREKEHSEDCEFIRFTKES